jgi:hypothetical protein
MEGASGGPSTPASLVEELLPTRICVVTPDCCGVGVGSGSFCGEQPTIVSSTTDKGLDITSL